MSDVLRDRRVAILATDGVERVELEQPRQAVEGAGRRSSCCRSTTARSRRATTTRSRPMCCQGGGSRRSRACAPSYGTPARTWSTSRSWSTRGSCRVAALTTCPRSATRSSRGELRGYTPLSRLEELETLSLRVEGKLAMWEALRRTHAEDPRLGPIDLDALIERARSQRARLERERVRAAEAAFG